MKRWMFALACVATVAAPAHAELNDVGPTGFVVTFQREVNAPPGRLWNAITELPSWWSSEHTWSGKASNMRIDLRAGGCWCETWDGNSVMHGAVVLVAPGKVLRFYANLGPLQDRATTGVLTFASSVVEGKTVLKWSYRVAGPPEAGLVELAPKVERVLGEQFSRLVAFAEKGKVE